MGQGEGAISFSHTLPAFSKPTLEYVSIGDTFYNNTGYQYTTDHAEFIIFESVLTKTELDDVYTRSVTRMADRGITVI